MRTLDRERLRHQEGQGLSPREREISALVAKGLSNKQIAGALGLKTATIKAHMSSIFAKLKVHNRVQLTLIETR